MTELQSHRQSLKTILYCSKTFRRLATVRKIGHFLLLEVMIAFALVVLAVLPLIYPHFYIYQQQRAFVNKIDLDVAVNLIYVNLMQKLHQNEMPWGDIKNGKITSIDSTFLEGIGYSKTFPYEGTYQFQMIKSKENAQYALHLVGLVMRFNPKNIKADEKEPDKGQLIYKYEVFIAQQFKTIPEAVTP